MKKIKIVLILFLVTCITSLNNVKADSYLGFAELKLPAKRETWTSDEVNKKTTSNQYIKKIAAIDNFSGDERAVEAQLYGVSTKDNYVTTIKGEYVTLNNGLAGAGTMAITHKIQLRAKKWTATTVTFSGMWVLDDIAL